MSKLNPKEAARRAAIERIRSGEGNVTLHLVAAAFGRCYRTAKRWADEEVLKVVRVTDRTIYVARAPVVALLDAMEGRGSGDEVDQRTILDRMRKP